MSKPNGVVVLAGLLWGIPLARAVPQDAAVVTEGARVRVSLKSADGARYTGTIVALRPDTLLVLPEHRPESVLVPIGAIRKLAVSRGPASPLRGAFEGVQIGVVFASAVGLVMLVVSDCGEFSHDWSRSSRGECTTGEGNAIGAVLIAVPVVAAIIGAARPGERWVNVPTKRLRASIAARGIGLAVSF